MSFTDFKEVSINNVGLSTQYGSNDLLDVMKILNGKVVAGKQVRILNPFVFTEKIEITAPVSLPTAPSSASKRHLVVDPADNHFKIQKNGGSLVDLESLATSAWDRTAAETLTNKIFQVNLNTLSHSTTNATGDLLKSNGTKYDRFSRGTALQLLRVNAAGTDLEWTNPAGGGGSGEANTASNIGTGTGLVGVFKQKTGVDLEFKKLHAASTLVTISDNVGSNIVDIDFNSANLLLQSIGGALDITTTKITGINPVSKGGTGVGSLTGLVKSSGTLPFTAIPNGNNAQVLTMVGSNPIWADLPVNTQSLAFLPDNTKWGGFWGGAADGNGIFAGVLLTGASMVGEQNAGDNYTRFETLASDASIAGFKTRATCTRRDYNPILKFRVKMLGTGTRRSWTGFTTQSTMPLNSGPGNTPLNGATGILFGFRDTDANLQITYNNGAASAVFIDTGLPLSTILSGTNVQLEFDNIAGKIKATVNANVFTPATTANTPAVTTAMFIHFHVEAIGSNQVAIAVNRATLTQDA
jgi:hypothetical protein